MFDLAYSMSNQPFAMEAVRIGLRISLGAFFAISGYHKAFNASRRSTLEQTFKADGCYNPALMYVIPGAELFGGIALLIGFLVPIAAIGLVFICSSATYFDGLKRIREWKPLDKADAIDDALYLPEVLYVVMLIVLALIGAGPFSIDALI